MALKLKIQFLRTVKLYLRSSGRNLMGDPSQLIVRTSLYFAKSEKWEQESELHRSNKARHVGTLWRRQLKCLLLYNKMWWNMTDEGDRGGGEIVKCVNPYLPWAHRHTGLVPPPLNMVTWPRALVTRPISDIIMVSIICLQCFISAALCLAQLT